MTGILFRLCLLLTLGITFSPLCAADSLRVKASAGSAEAALLRAQKKAGFELANAYKNRLLAITRGRIPFADALPIPLKSINASHPESSWRIRTRQVSAGRFECDIAIPVAGQRAGTDHETIRETYRQLLSISCPDDPLKTIGNLLSRLQLLIEAPEAFSDACIDSLGAQIKEVRYQLSVSTPGTLTLTPGETGEITFRLALYREKPIPCSGVSVFLEDPREQAVTDNNGYARFPAGATVSRSYNIALYEAIDARTPGLNPGFSPYTASLFGPLHGTVTLERVSRQTLLISPQIPGEIRTMFDRFGYEIVDHGSHHLVLIWNTDMLKKGQSRVGGYFAVMKGELRIETADGHPVKVWDIPQIERFSDQSAEDAEAMARRDLLRLSLEIVNKP